MTTASLRKLDRRARVIYEKNPLVEVIAAIRFPPVLRLIQEPPAEFQIKFAREYPFSEYRESTVQVASAASSIELNAQKPPIIRSSIFSTADKKWRVAIEPTLLALSCFKYEHWGEFRRRFFDLTAAFVELYAIGALTRIGVRFQDVINKEALGLADRSWAELIRAEALASFAFFTNEIDANPPVSVSMQLAIPPGRVNITLGTVTNSEKQVGFLIDTDCYDEQANEFSLDGLMAKADELHDYTSLVFQASITDLLHQSLRPKPPNG